MGKARRIGLFVVRRATLYLALKVLLTLFVLVYAASIVTTTTTYQAAVGGAVSVTNNLKAMDKGFSKAGSTISAAGTSCANNVTFTGSPGIANTAITANNIIYVVQVNTTASTAASTCFTATLVITPSGSPQQTYTVYVATDSTPADDETIDCKFDIGSSLPTSPYSFKVTVQ